MMVATQTDVMECMMKMKEDKEKREAMLTKLFTCIENKIPETKGFCHERNIPSMADIVCYNIVCSMPGAMKCGFDCKPFPKIMMKVKMVKMCEMMMGMMKKRMST
jgi:hypothetical protein